jgi:hypothetical protein
LRVGKELSNGDINRVFELPERKQGWGLRKIVWGQFDNTSCMDDGFTCVAGYLQLGKGGLTASQMVRHPVLRWRCRILNQVSFYRRAEALSRKRVSKMH